MDWKLELAFVPVTDVDRAKAFYESLGWTVDHDQRVNDELRFVQVTPPGSACSFAFGQGIVDAPAGSQPGLQIVVDDADAAHAHLTAAGLELDPVDDQPWGRFVTFKDPDGNPWAIQQLVYPDQS